MNTTNQPENTPTQKSATEGHCSHSNIQEPCCCNCKNQKKLMSHPWNTDFGKGSVLEQCGFVCLVALELDPNSDRVDFMDFRHSLCELHVPK